MCTRAREDFNERSCGSTRAPGPIREVIQHALGRSTRLGKRVGATFLAHGLTELSIPGQRCTKRLDSGIGPRMNTSEIGEGAGHVTLIDRSG